MLKAWDLTKNKLRHNCFDNIMQNIFRIITLENGTGQIVLTVTLTLLRMGFFGGCSRMGGGGGAKICHTYPTMLKLGTVITSLPKEDPKNISIMWHTRWVLLTSAFPSEISKFCYIRNTDIDCILIHNFYLF